MGDPTDHSTVEFRLNTEESPGERGILVVTRTPVMTIASTNINMLTLLLLVGSELSVMDVIVRNRISDPGSDPARGCL